MGVVTLLLLVHQLRAGHENGATPLKTGSLRKRLVQCARSYSRQQAVRATFEPVGISELNLTQGCILWVWIWRGVRIENFPVMWRAQYPFPAVLAIRTWACWERNKKVGIGLAFWILPCQIPAGILLYRFLDSLRCKFLGPPGSSFGLIWIQLGFHLPTWDPTAVSWWLLTNFCGEIGLCSWWGRVVRHCKQPIPPLLIRIPGVLALMAVFVYNTCSLLPFCLRS